LQGRTLARLQPIFWEHEGNRAVRDGPWKLVSKFPAGWELYDITTDRAEQHDLAAKETSRVKTMVARYDAWAKRAGVLPWPVNGAGKAGKKSGGSSGE
jgi:arylsulfatase